MALFDKRLTPEQEADAQVISETDAIWQAAKTGREKTELRWYIDESYYDNNFAPQYNTVTRQIQNVNANVLNDRVYINKAYQQVRGIVNFLNAEHPSVAVRPVNDADQAYLRAKREKHLADYWYDTLALNNVDKQVSTSAAKTGLGWWKVLYNTDFLAPTTPYTLDNGETTSITYGECQVVWADTWEVYPDPLARDKASMKYIVQAVVRTVAEIKNNSLYRNRDKVTGDNVLAASKLRSTQIRQNIAANLNQSGTPKDMDTVLTLEIFRKVYNQDAGKWEVWVTSRTENGVLLRNEKWNTDEFPYEYYTVEVAKSLLESRGIIYNIREPLRAMNQLISQVQESARIMGKLNWLMPRGSNVNVIDDTTGQFIEYDITAGGAPRQAEPGSLPSYIMQQIGLLSKSIDDIGGMHASFNGNAPFAQASGDLVDSLSEGDQNNLTLMRDNYDDAHVRLYKLLFKTAKENYTTSRKYPSNDIDEFGQTEWFEIEAKDINVSDTVRVSTGSQMPYSISQKQQMFMNLWKEHAITDPAQLFKLLQLPDLEATLGDDDNDIERQLDEIRSVMKKGKIDDPIIAENHGVHIATIDKFMRGKKFKLLGAKQQQALNDHRQKHIDLSIQLAQIQASMQVEPIKRSVTMMTRINSMNDTTPVERTQLMQRLGITSDAAQIQARGGLSVQDPAQAEVQAQNEDIEMMEMRSCGVSFADNHVVHLETHGQIINHPNFITLPQAAQKLFLQHQKDHIDALRATQSAPGLMPNQNSSLPNPVTIGAPQVAGEAPSLNEQNIPPLEAQRVALLNEEQQAKQQTAAFLQGSHLPAVQAASPPPQPASPQKASAKTSNVRKGAK